MQLQQRPTDSRQYEYHNPAPNVALAIYRTPEGAQQALNASPIRFSLERETPDSEQASYDADPEDDLSSNLPKEATTHDTAAMTSPSSLLTRTTTSPPNSPPSPPTPMPLSAPAQKQRSIKWFQVTLDRSRIIHQDFVERQPLWKQFNPMKSMAQEDLSKIVPLSGLSDVSKRPPHAHRTPNTILASMAKYVEKGMPSLRGISEGRESMGEDGRLQRRERSQGTA